MRRPPSYSDSFILRSPSLQNTPILEPLYIPDPVFIEPLKLDEPPLYHTVIIFVLKGALHIFFISSFETLFYFLYVSASENTGIKNTIDAYYKPLIQSCNKWSNISKTLIFDIIKYEVNKTAIDKEGIRSFTSRSTYNTGLLHLSIGYSVICLFIIGLSAFIIWWKKIQVEWQKLLLEHLAFVVVLALYEYFFYITIIYNYTTVSTAELNQYIIDGLYQCVS
jgi:hypothetical protein